MSKVQESQRMELAQMTPIPLPTYAHWMELQFLVRVSHKRSSTSKECKFVLHKKRTSEWLLVRVKKEPICFSRHVQVMYTT